MILVIEGSGPCSLVEVVDGQIRLKLGMITFDASLAVEELELRWFVWLGDKWRLILADHDDLDPATFNSGNYL